MSPQGQGGAGMDRDAAGGRRRRRRITYMSILGIMLLLHVLAWSSERFCDWYAAHVFRIWVETYGRAENHGNEKYTL